MAVADIRFAGGSAFGLEAASGVVRYLEARNIGFSTPGGIVPIVPTAVVYDLGYGDSAFRPDSAMGYEAACAASSHPPEQVSVGAGAGATVGKILGISRAMKGGFGSASDSKGGGGRGCLHRCERFRRRGGPGDRPLDCGRAGRGERSTGG